MAESAGNLAFRLATQIMNNIRQEFANKHLSMNLVNTMTLEMTNDGCVIRIPAQVYNMGQYLKQGTIIYTGTGSYAEALDIEGSYVLGRKIGNHIGWIGRVVNQAVSTWTKTQDLEVVIS